jgi:drug/metabolite transporter (DMT)-like permease
MSGVTRRGDPRAKVLFSFAAVYLIWGSTYLAIRYAIETLPPFLMAGVRYLIAGAILYVFARRSGAPAPTRRHWGSAFVLGALLFVGGNGGVVWAEQHIASGLAALLVATVPLWMVLLDWLRPGGSRPGGAVAAGLVLGTLGVALLVGPGAAEGAVDLLGAGAVILGALAWAAGSLAAGRLPLPKEMALASAMEMLAGGALLSVVGLLAGEGGRLSLAAVTPRSLLALAYLITFGSLVAFSAYLYLLRETSPARAATYAYVNPVVAVALGALLGGEALSSRMIAASAVIVAAVALIARYRGKDPRAD